VSPASGPAVGSGTVTFTVKKGATTIGTVTSGTVSAGSASANFPLSGVNADTYTIEAAYNAGSGFNGSNNSTQTPAAELTVIKAAGSVTINNIPANATFGGSFTPAYTKAGDGATSVVSNTPSVCSVSGGDVNFDAAGTCKLQAKVAEGTNHLAATGAEQSFTIAKAAGSVTINNIPTGAVLNGSFTPSYTKAGDGTPSTTSNTPSVCSVNNTTGVVSYVGAGTCTLQAKVAEGTNHLAATGSQQSFGIGFNFVGFAAPVDNTTSYMNVLKAGQAIPLKWRLTDANNQPVTNLAGATVTAKTLSCSIGATDDLMEEVAAGGSGLQNLGNGYYQFNWASPKSYANSCKTLHLDLGEKDANGNPVTHTAQFKFNK